MSWAELIEKAVVVGASSLAAGAGGYVLAALRLKKVLLETVTSAKEEISKDMKEAVANVTKQFKEELEKFDRQNDKDHEAIRKTLETDLGKVRHEVEVLENSHDQYANGQVQRWEEMNRTLGRIEGKLPSLSTSPPRR